MTFAKFLIVFVALIAVVSAQNATTDTWKVLDRSAADNVDIFYWVPVTGNTTQQAYTLSVLGGGDTVVSTNPAVAYFSGAFTKNFTVSSKANGTVAMWSLSGDTTGKTYFTATVTYASGPLPTPFIITLSNVTGVNGTDITATPTALSTSNPSTSEVYLNGEAAFFEVKSTSTSFTSNTTTTSSSLIIGSAALPNGAAVVVVVDFTAYPAVNNPKTTSSTSTFTTYIGVGSPPGGHLVLIIIICVAAGVVLSVIIFVVIYLRRRRNYERID